MILEDIVEIALQEKIHHLLSEKAQLEQTYLTKPMEEEAALNEKLKDICAQYGTYSAEAQQFFRENVKLSRDITRRILLQSKKGAIGMALERIAQIENHIHTLEDELCIRRSLQNKKFPTQPMNQKAS